VGVYRRSVFALAWGIAWTLDAAGRAVTLRALRSRVRAGRGGG
jgi:hypothetical protein